MDQGEESHNIFGGETINAIQIFLEVTQNLCEELCPSLQQCREKSVSQEVYEISNNSETTVCDLTNEQNYLSQKQNQIKNLLNSFKNHVAGVKDKTLMEKYCKLYSSSGINFSNLKKIVSKRIREKNTRWNMKLKSLLKSNHLSQIFYHYLENESLKWLSSSKVKERDSIIELIERLIQYQHNDQVLDEIKTYKK